MTTNTDIVNRLSNKLIETSAGCWEFSGARTGTGYGALNINGKMVSTHRLSFEIENGPIPKGMLVCHKCDNPPCCNPNHLFLGTIRQNKQDEINKGRHVYGEHVGNHILNEEDIYSIRTMLMNGLSLTYIAYKFNVTKQAIHRIKTNQCWAWLS